MSDFDLERLYLESVVFPGPNMALRELVLMRKLMERHLELARSEEIRCLLQTHASQGNDLHPEDRELDQFELQQRVTLLFPKVFRGGFVLVMWSMFESSIKNMAGYAGRITGKTLDPKLFRSQNIFVAAERAFLSTLNLAAFPDAGIRKQLSTIAQVRHVLVHHDGNLAELPQELRSFAFLDSLGLQVERNHIHEFIVPTDHFLDQSLSLIDAYLRALAERIFSNLHPITPDAM